MGSGPEASPAFPVLIYLGTSLRDLSDFLCSHAAEKRIGVTMHGGGRGNCPRPDSRIAETEQPAVRRETRRSEQLQLPAVRRGIRTPEVLAENHGEQHQMI